ncbi:MAG: NapC/NirT family cytochrome c [Candidatus Tectomicrobia bacterium]|nr:NapC/NirT family cytochrome c [Candidatus Tectomicrobia bacterium]
MNLRATYQTLSYGLTAALVAWAVYERLLAGGILLAVVAAAAYVAAYRASRSAGYLYPALLFTSAAYVLALRQALPAPWQALGMLPLLAAWQAVGLRGNAAVSRAGFAAASITAAAASLLTLAEVPGGVFAAAAGAPGAAPPPAEAGIVASGAALAISGLGFLLLAGLYLIVWRRQGNRWHLLGVLLSATLSWRYAAPLLSAGLPPVLLVAFAALPLAGAAVALDWRGRQALATVCFTAAVALVLACGLVAYVSGTPGAVLPVVLLGALVNAAVFWRRRTEESLYLVVLALGILASHFIRVTEDRFYGTLVNSFLYGLLLAGVIFCYPLLRRTFRWSWSLARSLSLHWQRVLLLFLPLMLGIVGMAFSYVNQVTESPSFCGSCHTMQTQYDTWKTSKHRNVGCVDCHYPPDLSSFVKGRTAGLLMAAKQVTGFYPTKSHGNVDSRSCQQGGCHGTEKLYRAITFRTNTLNFNHQTMLAQPARGIRLQCNTCHSRDVRGEHFATDFRNCYLCHFMNRRPQQETAVGKCTSCHRTLSERELTQRLTVRGDGQVARARCLDCHEDLTKLGEVQFLHDRHVSQNTDFTRPKVACLACHAEIEHGDFGTRPPGSAPPPDDWAANGASESSPRGEQPPGAGSIPAALLSVSPEGGR